MKIMFTDAFCRDGNVTDILGDVQVDPTCSAPFSEYFYSFL